MTKLILQILIFSLFPLTAHALELSSVAPSKAEPGMTVVLNGGPFTAKMLVYLGENQLKPKKFTSTRFVFVVPTLPPGEYALHVGDGTLISKRDYNFEILEQTPQILAISPRNIDSCFDGTGQTISITGQGLTEETSVLLNGLSVAKNFTAPDRLEFTLRPGMSAGVYGVKLKTPSGATSIPSSIWINDIPAIYSIEKGENFVNHYRVIVHGKNFYFNSILTVTQPENTFSTLRHQPLVLHAHENSSAYAQPQMPTNFDRIVYRDCQTLIYYRYPVDYQDKDLQLQVINPDGKKTDPFDVSLP
ncbi:MAG: IPT/TIG domain-containing protein [Geopsychrobacter sp.]|nr:IPT/TIG domain-containing protein [Geopsychrobacter sp.]